MKAVLCTGYGGAEVLKLADVPKPVPKDNEVLVKNYATTCHIGDTRIRSFDVPLLQKIPFRLYLGLTKPKRAILGMELAGEVESVGRDVKRFKPGEKVFACTGFVFGAHAEYTCVPEDSKNINIGMVAHMPSNMTYEEAAAGVTTGGITALGGLRKGGIRIGQKIMVYGASGSVGVFAVQLAKHYGAEVTGVCSAGNLEMVKSLGADNVIDYTKEELSKHGRDYDIVFDAVDKLSASKGKIMLADKGKYIKVGAEGGVSIDDFYFLKELVENGEMRTVIDRTYPLEQIVEAHKYVEKGHKKGHVLITISHQ
ncbi:MAG: NAD(P)-dependent alcohol dehydrogenase [Dehalococcoidales bacterium]|nr:MAG: NAD(P)-dependent alcohol dehydrogenase [Dehalococcoidales bacterium]